MGLSENPIWMGPSKTVIVEVQTCPYGRLFNIVKTSPRLGVENVHPTPSRNWLRIMITNVSRKISRTLSMVALASVAAFGSSAAMAQDELRPLPRQMGVYVGASAGLLAAQWECDVSCDRGKISGKIFGAKRLTPGLAAELNYMVFGGISRTNGPEKAQETGIALERRFVRALTAGINWEVELLEGFVNQIRLGWAFKRVDTKLALSTGEDVREREYRQAPYVGVGLAMNITNNLRVMQGFDYIIDGKNSQYLFSVGATAEF